MSDQRRRYRDREDYDRQSRSGHRSSGKSHWKWWVGLIIAAVIYVNNGGDLGQLFSGLIDGTGGSGGSPSHGSTVCTQYFRGGC